MVWWGRKCQVRRATNPCCFEQSPTLLPKYQTKARSLKVRCATKLYAGKIEYTSVILRAISNSLGVLVRQEVTGPAVLAGAGGGMVLVATVERAHREEPDVIIWWIRFVLLISHKY